jgi:hypothetical protein
MLHARRRFEFSHGQDPKRASGRDNGYLSGSFNRRKHGIVRLLKGSDIPGLSQISPREDQAPQAQARRKSMDGSEVRRIREALGQAMGRSQLDLGREAQVQPRFGQGLTGRRPVSFPVPAGSFESYVQLRSFFPNGGDRIGLPVILKIAWAIAGATCGIASSPTPEIHLLSVLRKWMLISGG